MASPPTLSILCFGDSLTSGFCDWGLTSHPYSIALQRRLAGALPGVTLQVHTNGVPGDTVSGPGFKRRLVTECEKRHYDWVVILGGTNDLAHRTPAEAIYNVLNDAWNVALLKGSKVLALTVPECHAKMTWLNDQRDLLNSSIKNHQEKNFYSFDLMPKIPFHSLTVEEKRKYWDDGLHLTPSGYDWMGDHIADALLPLLPSELKSQQPAVKNPSPKKPAPKRNDEATLEEEAGNPKKINQGYVVVRKRDLD